MTLNAPPHIAELLGKRVRVTNPAVGSSWEGVLRVYAADPSVIIDTDHAGRVCLPASFPVEAAPEPELRPCPACNGSGSAAEWQRAIAAADEAMADFLAASVAVWRQIDRLDAAPEGYHPVRMSVDLRKAERAAWERYRNLLPASGDCSGPATKP